MTLVRNVEVDEFRRAAQMFGDERGKCAYAENFRSVMAGKNGVPVQVFRQVVPLQTGLAREISVNA